MPQPIRGSARTHRGRAQVDREVLDAGNDIRAQMRRCAQRPKPRDTSCEFFKQHSNLHPSKACAQAEVRTAAAERHALVGLALDVEAERILEHVFIAIGRGVKPRLTSFRYLVCSGGSIASRILPAGPSAAVSGSSKGATPPRSWSDE